MSLLISARPFAISSSSLVRALVAKFVVNSLWDRFGDPELSRGGKEAGKFDNDDLVGIDLLSIGMPFGV